VIFFDQIPRLYRRIARKMKSFHSRNYFQDREYLGQHVDDELGVVKVMSWKYFSERTRCHWVVFLCLLYAEI